MERHQTLRATIDWSYKLLPPEEQTLFRRLAVFVGGWTLEAAETVCGDDSDPGFVGGEDILSLLEQLINKSIVFKEEKEGGTRYHLLETMRQYANEKLVDAEESDPLRDRHLEYFVNLAETASPHLIRPEQLEWLAQLDASYENLRLALDWALNKETAEASLRLCAALGKFWEIRCFWLEGSKWLKSALEKSTPIPTRNGQLVRVRALSWDFNLAEDLDELDRMKKSAELCFTLAQEISDRREIAIARLNLGRYRERCEDYDGALSLFEQSLAEFNELNEPYWTAVTNTALNSALAIKGNQDLTELVMRDVELARKAGEREHLGHALQEFSFWHFRNNRLDEAEKYSHEADLLLKEIGSNMNLASTFYADMAWVNGDFQEAAFIYNEIQERLGILGEKNIRSSVIGLLGLVTMESGNLSQSQSYLEQALAISREVDNTWFIASRLADLSYVFYLKGNIEKFKQFFMGCVSLTKELPKIRKVHPLLFLLQPIYPQYIQISVMALGAIRMVEKEDVRPLDPVHKRYWNKIEDHAHEVLGGKEFESAFAEGQKMSLDDVLDLMLKSVEEM